MCLSVRSLVGLNRRVEERLPAEGPLFLYAGSRRIGEAVLTDTSLSGFKVKLAPGLAEAATAAINPRTGQAYKVACSWAVGFEAGFRVLKTQNLRGFVDADLEPIQQSWLTSGSC